MAAWLRKWPKTLELWDFTMGSLKFLMDPSHVFFVLDDDGFEDLVFFLFWKFVMHDFYMIFIWVLLKTDASV